MQKIVNKQGDCDLIEVDSVPNDAVKIETDVILAGSSKNHRILGPKDYEIFEKDAVRYLKINRAFELDHPTHENQIVSAPKTGIYCGNRPMEFDPFEKKIRETQD